jgi:hypothetical protein
VEIEGALEFVLEAELSLRGTTASSGMVRGRDLAKDFEGSAATEAAWLLVVHLRLVTRRLAVTTNH